MISIGFLNSVYNEILYQSGLKSLLNKKLLIAVSGGIDSILLYHVFDLLSAKHNFKISMAHVNYNSTKTSKERMFLCKNLSQLKEQLFYLKDFKFNQVR